MRALCNNSEIGPIARTCLIGCVLVGLLRPLPLFSEPTAGTVKDHPVAKGIASAFDSQTARASLEPGKSEVSLKWTYANHWDGPLMIEKFDESCGCLRGKGDQEQVAPGKTGAISAILTPGAYRGTMRKSLHVRFVGYEEPVELVAEVHVTSTVEISTQELKWSQGEK